VAHELVRDLAVDRDGVVEALVAFDELLDRDRSAAVEGHAGEHRLQRLPVVHAVGARGARTVARLEYERIADPLREGAHGVRGLSAQRLRRGDAGLAQHVLHAGLVAAQPRRARGRAGDAAGLAHAGRRADVSLDRGLQPLHAHLALHEAHGVRERLLVHDGAHLLVVREPVPQLRIERLLRTLADADGGRAHRVQRARELALVGGKARLHEDHVHGTASPGRGVAADVGAVVCADIGVDAGAPDDACSR
jgi:hypothetical protein